MADQLRRKYPDETYARTLHQERDPEAEERHASSLSALIDLLVEAAVKAVIDDEEATARQVPCDEPNFGP